MILIKDIKNSEVTYIGRIHKLERIYNQGIELLKQAQSDMDYLTDSEKCSLFDLIILSDRMESTKQILRKIRIEIKKINLEILN